MSEDLEYVRRRLAENPDPVLYSSRVRRAVATLDAQIASMESTLAEAQRELKELRRSKREYVEEIRRQKGQPNR